MHRLDRGGSALSDIQPGPDEVRSQRQSSPVRCRGQQRPFTV